MPVGRREVHNKRGRGRTKGTNSPYSYKQKTSDESVTEESGKDEDFDDGSEASSTEDKTDGTTHRNITATPPSLTPPAAQSYHTSGHTTCFKRQSVSPKSKTTRDLLPEKVPERKHKTTKRMVLILIVFLIIVLLFSLHQSIRAKQEMEVVKREPKAIAEVYVDLKTELKRLNKEFSQPREVWLGLLSQFESVMVDSPSQPAVLLLVIPQDSKLAATCLAHQLARSIQIAFDDPQFIMYDTSSSGNRENAPQMKMELDEALKGLREAHAAVVHNVDKIPGPAAMILHAYCDNENAPFKQAILLLLADLPVKYKDIAYSRLDTMIDSHLTKLWGEGLPEKDVSALISRTSNAPILVRPEESSKVMALCPL